MKKVWSVIIATHSGIESAPIFITPIFTATTVGRYDMLLSGSWKGQSGLISMNVSLEPFFVYEDMMKTQAWRLRNKL